MNTNETIQAEIKRLADYLSGLEKDGKPLFPEVRWKCPVCGGKGKHCTRCSGRGYTVSLSREDWEQAAEAHVEMLEYRCEPQGFPGERYYYSLVHLGMIYEVWAEDKLLALLRAMEKLAKSLMGEKT